MRERFDIGQITEQLKARSTAAGLHVQITRDDGTKWDGYFQSLESRDGFIARAMRLGHKPVVLLN